MTEIMTEILIVEDNKALGEIFVEIVELLGANATLVHNGLVAMQWLDRNVPDGVILDLHLPNISGAGVLRHIRSDDRLKSVHVVVLSVDSLLLNDACIHADACFLKPIDLEDLENAIKRIISHS